jgi:hypothetical protein
VHSLGHCHLIKNAAVSVVCRIVFDNGSIVVVGFVSQIPIGATGSGIITIVIGNSMVQDSLGSRRVVAENIIHPAVTAIVKPRNRVPKHIGAPLVGDGIKGKLRRGVPCR